MRNIGAGVPDLPPAALDLLTSPGNSAERITREERSRNRAKNARLSFEVIQPQPQEHWLLVTSAFHMGRAMASFEAAGWQGITPYPVDFRTGRIRDGMGWGLAGRLDILNTALKERAGRWAYRMGLTDDCAVTLKGRRPLCCPAHSQTFISACSR